MLRTEAVVDVTAIRDNVATLKAATTAALMAVVKADGYGHGLVAAAQAARAGGATWFGTATLDEAIALRGAGFGEHILGWLWSPAESETVRTALRAGIDVSVGSNWQLDTVRLAASDTARIHLKIDTGLSRNGATAADWPGLVAAAASAQAAGEIEVVGIWSHLAYADEPGHPTIARQIEAFRGALDVAERAGINPQVRHLANSAATLTLPEAHFDLVRPGVAVYGLNPIPRPDAGLRPAMPNVGLRPAMPNVGLRPAMPNVGLRPAMPNFGLRPAMTLRAAAAGVKRVGAGEGVSYGHTYTTTRETTLVLVPLGYADGIPRHAGNTGPVMINGERFTVSGRVCMDQFVVDVGDLPVVAGDAVTLFGPGTNGEPTAQDWADAAGTIHYEIVTRIGPRVPRSYVGEL